MIAKMDKPLFRTRPDIDARLGLAERYSWRVWTAAMLSLIAVHWVVFGIVHNIVDTRICIGYSPDPLFGLIPRDDRWLFVTRPLYETVGVIAGLILFVQAFRGKHTALLRLSIGLCFMSSMRAITLLLIPLCRPTVRAFGPPPLASPETFLSIPLHMRAWNDVVYSGHFAFFLLILIVTNRWPWIARIALGVFLAVMTYGLIAAREHYTVDIVLAIPCAYFADACAVYLLKRAR